MCCSSSTIRTLGIGTSSERRRVDGWRTSRGRTVTNDAPSRATMQRARRRSATMKGVIAPTESTRPPSAEVINPNATLWLLSLAHAVNHAQAVLLPLVYIRIIAEFGVVGRHDRAARRARAASRRGPSSSATRSSPG